MLAAFAASSCGRVIAAALPPAVRFVPLFPPATWPGPADASGRRSCSFRGSSLPFLGSPRLPLPFLSAPFFLGVAVLLLPPLGEPGELGPRDT